MPSIWTVQHSGVGLSPKVGYLPSALSLMILIQAQAIPVEQELTTHRKRLCWYVVRSRKIQSYLLEISFKESHGGKFLSTV